MYGRDGSPLYTPFLTISEECLAAVLVYVNSPVPTCAAAFPATLPTAHPNAFPNKIPPNSPAPKLKAASPIGRAIASIERLFRELKGRT